MAFEAPPMETLLSSFFNISPADSFVCLFIKIYCTLQDRGSKGERGGGLGCGQGVGVLCVWLKGENTRKAKEGPTAIMDKFN